MYGPSVWHGPDYGWVYNEAESQKAWTYHWAFVRDNRKCSRLRLSQNGFGFVYAHCRLCVVPDTVLAEPQQAVVVGEWGGKCDTVDDQNWHNNMILFLKAKNLVDQFYW